MLKGENKFDYMLADLRKKLSILAKFSSPLKIFVENRHLRQVFFPSKKPIDNLP